ncbi:L,D-transpeptidase family protein [Streptomyces sp. NPDC046853]|uniref:L,D-transpeptidase family protein n=1 Tax=Streptomyces sp. NPDC046853 TaxID=3154920 RepID=UPI0033D893CC
MRPRARSRYWRTLASAGCLLLLGCASTHTAPAPGPPAASSRVPSDGRPLHHTDAGAALRIPGLGPATQAQIGPETQQAFVVTGKAGSDTATAVLYTRKHPAGWQRTAGPWRARNAVLGWTGAHRSGDLRTPIGVFRIGDAGGLLPNPGTRLPYDQDEEFDEPGVGYYGESLAGSFDHVVAIDYNRRSGVSPLDKVRPLGLEKGGGVWIHVDHGGPTKGCIALPRPQMSQLLRHLDPQQRPVIAMGPAAELRR